MTDEILTVKDIAAFFKVAEKTIYAPAKRGELPCFKVGGQWRFRRRDILGGLRTVTGIIVFVIGFTFGGARAQDVLAQEARTMNAVNWQKLFKQNPLFSSLAKAEIAQLLTHEASQERTYVQDDLIVRAGEEGDSLFLIGVGSVQVTVWGVPVATLPAGELFGEMAVLDRKPRAATVTAKEHSTLLEITGEAFRKLLEGHQELRTKVGAKVKERMEQSNQQ